MQDAIHLILFDVLKIWFPCRLVMIGVMNCMLGIAGLCASIRAILGLELPKVSNLQQSPDRNMDDKRQRPRAISHHNFRNFINNYSFI